MKERIEKICCVLETEFKTIVKDEGILLFLFFVPLIYPLLYSWIYNNEVVREIPVIIVDQSHTSQSRLFARKCDASPDLRIVGHANSIDEGREAIAQQKAFGIVYIPQDFTARINRLEQATVSVYCDMSLMLAYKAIFQTVMAVSADMNSDIQVMRGGLYTDKENDILTAPLKIDEVAVFNEHSGYGSFILPGVLMLIIQQTLLLSIGLAAGTRYEHLTSPAKACPRTCYKTSEVFIGRTLTYFLIYVALAAYLLLAVPCFFGFVQQPRPLSLLLFALPYILACIFFAITISVFVRQRENVMLLVVFSSVLLLFMSGVSWPQSNISGFWRTFACLFPSTFGIQGFVALNTMGAELEDIRWQVLGLLLHILVYGFLAYFTLRQENARFSGKM
ncbi:MAG: ABC transporter permease [Prevotella sp.]